MRLWIEQVKLLEVELRIGRITRQRRNVWQQFPFARVASAEEFSGEFRTTSVGKASPHTSHHSPLNNSLQHQSPSAVILRASSIPASQPPSYLSSFHSERVKVNCPTLHPAMRSLHDEVFSCVRVCELQVATYLIGGIGRGKSSVFLAINREQ